MHTTAILQGVYGGCLEGVFTQCAYPCQRNTAPYRDVVCMLADVFARHPGLARQQVIRYTRQGTEGPARMWLLGNMLMRVGMMTDAVLV